MTIELIYWDSDAFLGYLQNEPGKVDLCHGTLERAEKREVLIITSALTLAEVLWMKGAPKVPQDKADIVRKFFRRSFMRVRNVTRTISEDAQDLVWNHSIRPKDAIHVATAIECEAAFFETFDDFLLKKTGQISGSSLIFRAPLAPAQKKLL